MDSFIRYLVVEINLRSTNINEDILLPSYTAKYKAEDGTLENFASPKQIFSRKVLKQIDDMLLIAKQNNIRSGGKNRIKDFLMANTDLNDCHMAALNEFKLSENDRF